MHQDLERFVVSKQSDNYLMPIDVFERTLVTFFPQKNSQEISDLLVCVQSSATCIGKDVVDVSRLFDNGSESESPFLQLLWRQGLNERALISQSLQVSNLA